MRGAKIQFANDIILICLREKKIAFLAKIVTYIWTFHPHQRLN
ncbi:hypothetical protein EV194_10742 [Natronoflexus pectinivorans]|uniref:Uncharacterized protein n=1 Tax=Natronoflexus pectinivorans TaxID=682526 RepID=A0A4R2GH08_9BACT|nr:hypothetical protein EV194_10742 [Natronoflexus pectinivorans]